MCVKCERTDNRLSISLCWGHLNAYMRIANVAVNKNDNWCARWLRRIRETKPKRSKWKALHHEQQWKWNDSFYSKLDSNAFLLRRHASRCVWRVADWTTLQCRLNDCNISQLTANQIIYRERAVVIYETQDVGDFINLTRCAMRIERKTNQVTFLWAEHFMGKMDCF